jgi:uncharacterized protein YkwD
MRADIERAIVTKSTRRNEHGLRRRAPFLALAVMLAGCAELGAPKPVATNLLLASTPADGATAAALISRYRRAHGLNAVTDDATLTAAAQQQARAVAAAGALFHGDFPGRMAAFGIKGVAAENLSAGRASVAEAIAGWKASAGHNANLLLAGVDRIGVARIDTPGTGYKEYWALVLAR